MKWYRVASNPKDGSVVKCRQCNFKVWADDAKRIKECPNEKCEFDGDKAKAKKQMDMRMNIAEGESIEDVVKRMKERK